MDKFTLKILWLNHDIGLAIDHILEQGHSPLTPYFFWPRNNAWSQIKAELELKPWISERDTVKLLNQATRIINYWQDSSGHKSNQEIQNVFPEFTFYGYEI